MNTQTPSSLALGFGLWASGRELFPRGQSPSLQSSKGCRLHATGDKHTERCRAAGPAACSLKPAAKPLERTARCAQKLLRRNLTPKAQCPKPNALIHRSSFRQPGFTLLEMIVVLSIFALLTGIAIPVAGVALRIEETNSTRDRMADLSEGIRNFYHDVGRFPISLDELITAPKKLVGWAGPYVNQGFTDAKGNILYDGWQNAFQYLNVDAYTKRLRSLGLNAANDGGTGDDIDLDINVADLLRDVNNDILGEINTAISLYNQYYRVTDEPPVGDGNVVDVPLTRPWSNALSMLVGAGLLGNSNSRYTADVWGNAFIAGPDPVQYVTSQGSQ